ARPRAIREKGVLARTDPEQLLQQLQRLARGHRVRVRAEEAARQLAGTTVVGEPRELVRGQVDVRKALVVLEQHVVARTMALDQVELEQQRLGLRGRDRDLDSLDLAEQRERLVG